MSNDIILKKLEQIQTLLLELKSLLELPFSDFSKNFTNIRSAERNFQLIIELASDINAHISIQSGSGTPDTYRESFKKMVNLNILTADLLPDFIKSANLRNILIHEYDFDQDNFIFYNSAKSLAPLYDKYMDLIKNYLNSNKS